MATFCEEVEPLPVDGLLVPADDDEEPVLRAGMANDWCIVGEGRGLLSEMELCLLKGGKGMGLLEDDCDLTDVAVSVGLDLGDALLAISLILLTHWAQYHTCRGSLTSLSITRGS